MKNLLRLMAALCVFGFGAAALRAEEFSKALTPEEFAAAGLGKLTPEELARLDALVQAQRSGELAKVKEETATKVREETTVKVREETTAKVRAEVAAEKPAHEGGLLKRVRVLLTPGTQIDYEKVETALKGPFRGYQKGTRLHLANGQVWQVTEGSFWAPKKDEDKPRKVVIEPGTLGSFFLNIADGGRPRVKFAGNE
jgi:hypothetical protein